MPKLFKFGYYNIAFGITTWLILFLYKIDLGGSPMRKNKRKWLVNI